MATNSPNPPNPDKWWAARRRLAYLATFAGLAAFPGMIAFCDADTIAAASTLITSYYTFCGLIVLAYIGSAGWSDVAAKYVGSH